MNEEYKKDKGGGGAPVASWEVIYCSLALILVAFFAMLVSYSTVEENKMTNFIRGFSVSSEKTMMDGLSSSSALRKFMAYTAGRKTGGGGTILRNTPDMIGSDKKSVVMGMSSLTEFIENAGIGNVAHVERTDTGFKATFGSSVMFPSGVATINKNAIPYLDKMIAVMKKNKFSVRIEGHTDNVPIQTEQFPSNWELSTARAVNVLRYFLDKGKIPPMRLAAVGFSEYHPIASNDTTKERQTNRRVEFYFEIYRGEE
ncbi:MAG: OmpA family protein [Deltaproteobacteria bacterium]|nr:OmpA family protein [Deltaproteobacteria bacterium]